MHNLVLGPPHLGKLVTGIGIRLKLMQLSFSGRAEIVVYLHAMTVHFGGGSGGGRIHRVTLVKQTCEAGKVIQVQVLWNSQTSRAVSLCSLILV